MGFYGRAIKDKTLASDIILPLVEFEFCFCGDEQVKLVQSFANAEQTQALHQLCKVHGWAKGGIKRRRNLVMFSLSKCGFCEIYSQSGPMLDAQKDAWAKLLVERKGKGGGRQFKEQSKREIHDMLLQKGMPVGEICAKLRIQPSSVRESLRRLRKEGLVLVKRVGKKRIYFPVR